MAIDGLSGSNSSMASLARFWQRGETKTLLLALGISAALIIIGQILNPGFGSIENIGNILALASILTMGAAGQTLVIICGDYGIDLSIGALMSMGAVMGSGVLRGSDSNLLLTVIVLVAIGAAFGLLNGLAVWYLKIPSLVMTLAMGSVVNGFTLAVSEGRPFGSASPLVLAFGGTRFFGWLRLLVVVVAFIVILVTWMLKHTRFGKLLFLVGDNRSAAVMVGVNTGRIVITTFVLSGICGSMAGLLLFSTVGQAQLMMAESYVMLTVAAVVLGGTQISGGKGSYLGTAAGALVIIALTNVLISIGVPEGIRFVITGIVLILILSVSSRQKNIRQ